MKTLAALLLATTLGAACAGDKDEELLAPVTTSAPGATRAARSAGLPARDEVNPRLLRRFRPVARPHVETADAPALVDLGRMLWYDARLSTDGQVSCNGCHPLDHYGADGRPTSIGVGGQHGRRNAPTPYNAADHIAQFWDGRARDLEEQAAGPIVNPAEMASTREQVETALRAIPGYREPFRLAFPAEAEPITLQNVARAIAAFERGLTTHSRWDDYVAGNAAALTPAETHGLRVFLDVGCMGCHTGPQVGASMFQVAGFVEPWPDQSDTGRFEVTGVPTDRMVFKVPTLKNVDRTAPYFHDGSGAALGDAIRIMGRRQLGIELDDEEVVAIEAFFGALTGELPAAYIARPELPR